MTGSDAWSGRAPRTVAEAVAVQDELRSLVDLVGPGPTAPATVAGLDVAYAESGDRLAAAVTVLDAATLAVVDEAVSVGRPAFPYVPGLFAFRELPALRDALDRLTVRPDLLVCDGHGLAHPRRFGLACHLGVVTGLPAIGVGKTPLVGEWEEPGLRRGAWTPLRDGGAEVGRVVRTRDGVKPVFVSVGHRISLDNAVDRVLALTPRYRLPETTRTADQLCRAALAATPA
ncbi:endonuclease V [Micromonospora globispora]|uniref:Endonuclease V n=1 Tax=Micromonospora globispora TaxID=1450148 RepID=A0A317K4Z9_9ACTN|nr:deoxyribonuclease V [Micromonospora globispora]PWU48215.1 endonuclease V [Micromonospora globispora]PWU60825.1 endonuclease V [Micromonospora globispora]RQW90612.1 endonuclease V [Micromonospora globispora]